MQCEPDWWIVPDQCLLKEALKLNPKLPADQVNVCYRVSCFPLRVSGVACP
jgi:hypothetical protein